jgi:Terminase RNaseH-like domain
VEEWTEVFDTPAMIRLLKSRYEGHQIIVYPDASGRARDSNNASASDLQLLRGAGFQVFTNPANPAVKDRVLAMNSMIHADGRRRLRVNPDGCPTLVEALEKQAYTKNGEPDKTSGLDHIVDAMGYFVAYRYPIKGRGMMKMVIGGI